MQEGLDGGCGEQARADYFLEKKEVILAEETGLDLRGEC